MENSPLKGFKVLEKLGNGSYGTVYKVECPQRGKAVLKIIDLAHLPPKKQQEALKEVQILQNLNHPHVISYYYSCVNNKQLYILMEYAEAGDLQSLISSQKAKRMYLGEKTIWEIAYQVCLGVNYLHSKRILHRDLKCMNVLLNSENKVKLADLGVSKLLDNSKVTSQVGTPLYLSPEIVQNKPYDFKADSWAIGCILYNLASLQPPFSGDNLVTLARNIVKSKPNNIPQCYSPKLNNFILKFLIKNPLKRIELKDTFELFPKFIKDQYFPTQTPAVQVTKKKTTISYTEESQETPLHKTIWWPKHKRRSASVNKNAKVFKEYLMTNNRLASSRSLWMKPMQNSKKRPSTAVPKTKTNLPPRPNTAHLRVININGYN